LKIANGGIAGEVSENGVWQVREQLTLFPNARYFIVGYGTNDLGMWPDLERTSQRIIANLDQMVHAVMDRGKQPILFNVPYANESMFSVQIAEDLHAKRDYHNEKLKEFCDQRGIALADICSHLRDEHFADELHPNEAGAKIIAEQVFEVLGRLRAVE
jgi:lysophospholipase L1-like esterase